MLCFGHISKIVYINVFNEKRRFVFPLKEVLELVARLRGKKWRKTDKTCYSFSFAFDVTIISTESGISEIFYV